MILRLDDLQSAEVAAFLEEHLRDMRVTSPPESKHALDLKALRQPEVTFWSGWENQTLVACCALKQLDPTHGELKSMRVTTTHRGRGLGSALVTHLIAEGQRRGYQRLSLETGIFPFFKPAHALYQRHGFKPCGPFGSYRPDPNSLFLTRELP